MILLTALLFSIQRIGMGYLSIMEMTPKVELTRDAFIWIVCVDFITAVWPCAMMSYWYGKRPHIIAMMFALTHVVTALASLTLPLSHLSSLCL